MSCQSRKPSDEIWTDAVPFRELFSVAHRLWPNHTHLLEKITWEIGHLEDMNREDREEPLIGLHTAMRTLANDRKNCKNTFGSGPNAAYWNWVCDRFEVLSEAAALAWHLHYGLHAVTLGGVGMKLHKDVQESSPITLLDAWRSITILVLNPKYWVFEEKYGEDK
jgi:hypothetical protein